MHAPIKALPVAPRSASQSSTMRALPVAPRSSQWLLVVLRGSSQLIGLLVTSVRSSQTAESFLVRFVHALTLFMLFSCSHALLMLFMLFEELLSPTRSPISTERERDVYTNKDVYRVYRVYRVYLVTRPYIDVRATIYRRAPNY